MIELVYEIRRTCPSDLKPSVKLANPELFDELRNYYFDSATAVNKALIKELFNLAGGEWAERLDNPTKNHPRQQVKVYRGQTVFEDKAPAKADSADERKNKTPKKMYRGRVVA